MPACRKYLSQFIDCTRAYCDAAVTGLRPKHNSENSKFYSKIRSIWENKRVVVVGCKELKDAIQYDLFDNASGADWVFIPNKNAFSNYNQILQNILVYPKNVLVVLMAGPTAKVLVDDLVKQNYRALDLGHVAKSYDWYCKDIRLDASAVKKFWRPDE